MQRISHGLLFELACAVATGLGSHAEEAQEVARHLVGANLAGHDSHGLGMLPDYVELAHNGLLKPNNELETVLDLPAFMILEAGRGFGQWMGRLAMRRGMDRAKTEGACVVGLRNASHIGRIGSYAEQCAEAGFVSMHFVNVADHVPAVAPFGGSDARFVTNPFAVGLPGRKGPSLVLDMATSTIALGKARVARNKGVPVPDNCIIDAKGRPTNDPLALVDNKEGALVAFGAHKGSGLAIMCEMLGGALTGGATIHPGHPRQGGIVNSMLSIIIDAGAAHRPEALIGEIEAVRDYVKASPPAPGVEEVLVPGEPERIARETRMRDGIPLDDKSLSDILAAAEQAGVEAELLDRVRMAARPS